jgi:hypothetical protein
VKYERTSVTEGKYVQRKSRRSKIVGMQEESEGGVKKCGVWTRKLGERLVGVYDKHVTQTTLRSSLVGR